jgi:hypothetical protein
MNAGPRSWIVVTFSTYNGRTASTAQYVQRTSLLHNAIINLDMSICRYLRTFHTHIDISGDFPLKFHPSSIVYALSHKSISADNRI